MPSTPPIKPGIHLRSKPLARSIPSVAETLAVFLVTMGVSLVVALLVRPLPIVSEHRIVVSWASHVPQFIIPWLWYRSRVAPFLPVERRSLVVWPPGSLGPLLKIGAWMVGIKFALALVEASLSPTPEWVHNGLLSIVLVLLFQGLVVGLTEEMMVRPTLHRTLLLRSDAFFAVGRLRLSYAWLTTSVLFGMFHLPNAFLGQPLVQTLIQVFLASVVGGLIGFYYERTLNYLGAALLHGLFDGVGPIAYLLALPFK